MLIRIYFPRKIAYLSAMVFWQLLLLGAIAGLTIFLGLPFAFMRNLKPQTRSSFTGFATGILLFLGIEVVGKVLEIGSGAVVGVRDGSMHAGHAVLLIALAAIGMTVGLVGIPLVERTLIQPVSERRRARLAVAATGVPSPEPRDSRAVPATTAQSESAARIMSLSIATGIGLHNFGEGLAIGQSAATGAVSLALLLVVGFGLHNMTEGFGVAAPLGGTRPRPAFVVLAGLIAGSPTFIGTLVGSVWTSDIASAIFLSVAGGSLAYITAELFSHGRKAIDRIRLMVMITIGFLVAFGTDLVVTAAGA